MNVSSSSANQINENRFDAVNLIIINDHGNIKDELKKGLSICKSTQEVESLLSSLDAEFVKSKKYFFSVVESKKILNLKIEFFPKIDKISYLTDIEGQVAIERNCQFLKKEFYRPELENWCFERLQTYYQTLGYRNINFSLTIKEKTYNQVSLIAKLDKGGRQRIRKIFFNNIFYKEHSNFKDFFHQVTGSYYDRTMLSEVINLAIKSLESQGFRNISIQEKNIVAAPEGLDIYYDVSISRKINIYLSIDNGPMYFDLRKHIRDKIRISSLEYSILELKTHIDKYLNSRGRYESKIKIDQMAGIDRQGLNYTNYYINVKLGRRLFLSDVSFHGLEQQEDQDLSKIFYQNGSDLIRNGFYDRGYLDRFKDEIGNYFLSKGYLFASVTSVHQESEGQDNIRFEYNIQRGHKMSIRSIQMGLPPSLDKKIRPLLVNKEGGHFNPLVLADDIKKIMSEVDREGYLNASAGNVRPKDIVFYDFDNYQVDLKININLGRKIAYYATEIKGNTTTKIRIFDYHINLKKGELLSKQKLDQIRVDLLSTSLFESVDISVPIERYIQTPEQHFAYIVINVNERKRGRLEVAPGIRSDLGIKLASTLSYRNLWGHNRTTSLKILGNRRFVNNFDPQREYSQTKRIEYDVEVDFKDPYFYIPFNVQFSNKVLYSRRRFYSFDAEILRLSSELSSIHWNFLNTFLKYQIESINQENAAQDNDSGYFRIGSLLPGFSINLKNSEVLPTAGLQITTQLEFAKPTFYSLNRDDLRIDYTKLLIDTSFYIPHPLGTVAFNLAGGVQKNHATDQRYENEILVTQGYIPGIKVFRLDGFYNVRGFAYDEINRLSNGDPVGEYVVIDKFYFVNYKIEPRFFLNDSAVLGVFFDAGGLRPNSFKPLEVRSSVGVSFKILTPIGTLDFDYGLKLQRISDDKRRESLGRIHYAVGHF